MYTLFDDLYHIHDILFSYWVCGKFQVHCIISYYSRTDESVADNTEEVPPLKPPRRRSSVNRSRSLSLVPIKTSIASEQQESFYDTLK